MADPAKELLQAAADSFRAENAVKMCAHGRRRHVAIAGETARLHHVLEKILGDQAPRPSPSLA